MNNFENQGKQFFDYIEELKKDENTDYAMAFAF
jgi:hypothetical protein